MTTTTEKMVVIALPDSVVEAFKTGRVSKQNREVLVRACELAEWRSHEWRAIDDYHVECGRCSAAPASYAAAFSCGIHIPEQTTTGETSC